MQASAFWLREPGVGEIRRDSLPDAGPDDVVVRALHSGVSRGTELLVFRGGVPASVRDSMRAPFQGGEFPAPVKYGYLSVGVVEIGPQPLVGREVFCLYPHQTTYVVPADSVVPLPDGVAADRAVLAGTVETAINALWDVPPLVGDHVTVIGAGMVGCCVARLAARVPGATVTLVDSDPTRSATATALGVAFASPDAAPRNQDLTVHCTASASGLQLALDCLADDATVLDLSWYGDAEVTLSLGARFHTGRLGVRASQVGTVSPARRGRRTTRDRLELALDLLRDPAFDALLTSRSNLAELPNVFAEMAAGRHPGLCHVVDYEE